MEENKVVVAPKKEKKVPTKKVAKNKVKPTIQTNFARGFFVTGLLGIVFFSLVQAGIFTTFLGSNIDEFLLNTELQIAITMFLVGAFSFNKK
jgi:hypothetical protein